MNKIVLLNGREWKTRVDLMHLAVMWECVKNGTAKIVVIPAVDEHGVFQDLNVRKIDPDKSFGNIVYDRHTPIPTIPPTAA